MSKPSSQIPHSTVENRRERRSQERLEKKKMVRVATYFTMTFGAFLFWQSMDKVHVWIALHQDEKVSEFSGPNLAPCLRL
jgi:hypothetical protein